jgi:hypothetical protein
MSPDVSWVFATSGLPLKVNGVMQETPAAEVVDGILE